MIGFGIGSRAPQLVNAGRATAIERDDSRSPWYRLLLRPTVLLVALYSIAICFERIIEVDIFKPYRLIGATLIFMAVVGGRLIVDRMARLALLYVVLGFALGVSHVLLVSASLSELLGDSLLWLFNVASYIAICSLLRSRRELTLVLVVHAAAMLFASYDILNHSAEMFLIEGESVRVSGDFKNPANACLSMMVAALVTMSVLRGVLAKRRGFLATLLAMSFGLAVGLFELYVSSLTGSRAGAFMLLIGLLAYLLVLGRRRIALVLAAVGIGAAVLVTQMDAWPKLQEENILLVRAQHKGLDVDRVYLWRSGLDAYIDSYGLGIGIAQYRTVHKFYFEKYALSSDERWADSKLSLHNDYMSALVEFGTFGFIILMVICRHLWRTARGIIDNDVRAMAIALLLAAAFMAFSHAVLPYFGLWFYLALTSLWRRFENADARLQAAA